MSFGIRPLGDKVVIEIEKAEEKTSSGFILTGQAKEPSQIAKVVAVGPGTDKVKMEVEVGDSVVFSLYGGTPIKYDGEEYVIISQKEILAVVE